VTSDGREPGHGGEDHGRTRPVRLTAWVDGHVQGVGFRAWVRLRATELGLSGSATNLEDGRVEVVAEGEESDCRRLLAALASGSAPGRVTRITQRWSEARDGFPGFIER
jgi:acylphosphatase